MIKVKICGMMREEDIEAARKADYLGFVVESGTRRSLSIEKARDLMGLSDRKKVAVLTSQNLDHILRAVERLEPDALQLHSVLPSHTVQAVAEETSIPLWGLVPVGNGVEEERIHEIRSYVDTLLLDSFSSALGGSGRVHDWTRSRELRDEVDPQPIILSGGLRAENVKKAIAVVNPAMVDVSSGVEENGAKSAPLIDRFMSASRSD